MSSRLPAQPTKSNTYLSGVGLVAASDSLAFCPMVFCFNTYARDARAGAKLRFATPPVAPDGRARGAIAGGTGLAGSASSPNREAAIEAAAYLVSAASQVNCAIAGGQPRTLLVILR